MAWFNPATAQAAARATVANAPATGTPIGQGTAAQNSAIATIGQNLADLGLPASLGSWAWGEIQAGKDPAQVLIDLEGTSEFKTRFPAIDALRQRQQKGENVHVPTPAEYVQFETTTSNLMRNAGLPAGFYDSPDDFTTFITNQVSPKEISDRIQGAQAAVYSSPPEVRDAMERYYGVSPGDAVAMWLNPDKAVPLLQNQAAAARIGGTGQRVGYGMLSRAEAERLQGAGVTDQQAEQGLGTLALERPLFENTIGESTAGENITREEQLSTLTGNANAQTDIERRRAQRAAQFGGGGGAGQTGGRGGTGLGSAGSS